MTYGFSVRDTLTLMDITLLLVIFVVIVALAFDFTNGFHDAANAIATVVATKALTMKQALAMAAVMNLLGAFIATAVAKTIQSGLVEDVGDPYQSQILIIGALIGAIGWNILTWFFGIPSSSSHAIVGGLVGAGMAFAGTDDIIWSGVVDKVIVPMLVSPIFAAAVAGLIMIVTMWAFKRVSKETRKKNFRWLQIGAGAFMAFSHGSNDAQKTMGVITLALVGANLLPGDAGIPWWVVLLCALAMAGGTWSGGKRIIETAGKKITALEQESGFVANISGSITILLASRMGLPVSTTHVVMGAITGAGAVSNYGKKDAGPAVNWGTWRNMIFAWILTIPGSAGIAGGAYLILWYIFGQFDPNTPQPY